MFLKSFALLGAATVGGAWAFGAFDEYPRTVEGSPETIMAELADLDIRELPGSPGTDAAAAGGVKPRFQLERGENRMDWFVMSGSQVATRMTAFLEPVDGGTNTRITYEIERGDSPDEMTSPAFRSESMTGSLFQLALNTEIDEINAPGWGPECDAIAQNIMGGVVGIGDPEAMANWEEKGDPADRIKQVGKVALKLGNARKEMLAAGCNPDIKDAQGRGPDGFKRVTNTVGESSGEWGDDGSSVTDSYANLKERRREQEEQTDWGKSE